MRHANNVVNRILEHREPRESSFDKFCVQFFQRHVRGNRDDVRARSHDFAHAFVAELHDLFDQIGLLRLDDAFFFGGFDQRLDSFFGALLVGFFRFFFRNARKRFRAFHENAERPDEPQTCANRGQQRQEPSSGCAIQQKIRNKMHDYDNFERDKYGEFDDRFPGSSKKQNSARGFENQKCEPEMSEDAESASGATPIYFKFRFDFGFKDIEMLVNRAGGHAAKLAVNQSEVGKNGKKESEQNDADGVEPRVVHDSSPSLRRNLPSTLSIWP